MLDTEKIIILQYQWYGKAKHKKSINYFEDFETKHNSTKQNDTNKQESIPSQQKNCKHPF